MSRAPRGSPSTSSAGTMLPPSWLTALCAPAAPTRTCTCCSSARAEVGRRGRRRPDRRRPRPGHGRAGRRAPSAWPTGRPRAAPPGHHRPRRRRRPCRGAPPTRWSPPAPPAPPSPPPRSASAAGPGCAARRWPPCCRPSPARSSCSTSARRSTPDQRDPGAARRARRRVRRRRARHRRAPGRACSRSAPSRARATGCAGPPTPLLAAAALPAGARYVGLVEGYDVVLGGRGRRGGHRRLHRQRAAQGHRGRVRDGRRHRRPAAARPGGRPARRGRHRGGLPRRGRPADDVASGIALAAELHRGAAPSRADLPTTCSTDCSHSEVIAMTNEKRRRPSDRATWRRPSACRFEPGAAASGR